MGSWVWPDAASECASAARAGEGEGVRVRVAVGGSGRGLDQSGLRFDKTLVAGSVLAMWLPDAVAPCAALLACCFVVADCSLPATKGIQQGVCAVSVRCAAGGVRRWRTGVLAYHAFSRVGSRRSSGSSGQRYPAVAKGSGRTFEVARWEETKHAAKL